MLDDPKGSKDPLQRGHLKELTLLIRTQAINIGTQRKTNSPLTPGKAGDLPNTFSKCGAYFSASLETTIK